MKVTKYLAAAAAVCIAGGLAWGGGLWQTMPIIGGAAYCSGSNIVGPAQQTITGQSGTPAGANATTGNVICTVTEPAGPPALVGTEVVPVDINTPGTAQPNGGAQTAVLPVTALGQGYGAMQVFTTTGTTASVVVANGINSFIYAGGANNAATITSLSLPPNPMQNQDFCISNASTGTSILTLTAVAVGTSGQSIVGVTPTSVPVATAVGTAGTVTLSRICWQYQVSNTSWYRIQ
jgi:hypothetical protein